jgi:hypothetical protein
MKVAHDLPLPTGQKYMDEAALDRMRFDRSRLEGPRNGHDMAENWNTVWRLVETIDYYRSLRLTDEHIQVLVTVGGEDGDGTLYADPLYIELIYYGYLDITPYRDGAGVEVTLKGLAEVEKYETQLAAEEEADTPEGIA